MATQLTNRYNSQGNIPHNGRYNIRSDFCTNNKKLLIGYSGNELEILSSKKEPSNQKSPSSKNIFLPQGYQHSFTPNFRFDSSKLMPFFPMAGCISLLNYYWKYNVSSIEEDSLLGVQIFIFHIYNNSDKYVNINLRILLHSTQDATLDRPVAIVLSSFLPRRFLLSVLSYLSRTQHPIHIIMTNFNSDVILNDQNLNESDLKRIHISVLDSSYDGIFKFKSPSSDDGNLLEIREKISHTNLMKSGVFSGFRYNSMPSVKVPEELWLFDNGNLYSERKPNIKLVAIYIVFNMSNVIDIVLDRPEDPRASQNNELYGEQCAIVNDENLHSLADRMMTFSSTNYPLNHERTCSYFIRPQLGPAISNRIYKSVSWLHLENPTENTVHLKLTSNRLYRNDETHLVILTANNIKESIINIEPFLLYKKVHIVSNISLDQFDQRSRQSSFLISLELTDGIRQGIVSQDQIVANYIAASASSVMQTTIYQLKPSTAFEIRINVDDSRVHSIARVNVNPSCWCNSDVKTAPFLSIDLDRWKQQNNWIPSQFIYGDNNDNIFKPINETLLTFKTRLSDCSARVLKSSKVYGILHGKRYLLNLPFKYQCPKRKKVKITTKTSPTTTTEVIQLNLIERSEQGFNVFNDTRFKTVIGKKPLHDGDQIYIELTQSVAWDISLTKGMHLRDCYITNKKATNNDLKYSNQSSQNFKKLIIVKGGCIDQMNVKRAVNHDARNNLLFRFSIGVDANKWASHLSLHRQYMHQSGMEVHLYCGVNRCYSNLSKITDPILGIGECSAESECLLRSLWQPQQYMYYGTISIIRESNFTVKISILVVLLLLSVILLLFLVLYLRHLYMIKQTRFQKHNRFPSIGGANDMYQQTCLNIPVAGPIYCSVKVPSTATAHRSQYESDRPDEGNSPCWLSSSMSSLHPMLTDSDRSLILQASYIALPHTASEPVQSNSSSLSNVPALALQPVPENPESHVDRPLYSWPLSSADYHNRQSNHSQSQPNPPRPPITTTTLMSRLSFRFPMPTRSKLSVTDTNSGRSCTSDPKLSSNRTTVSGGESAGSAVSDIISGNKSSFKWWTPLSNYSSRKTFVMSRRI